MKLCKDCEHFDIISMQRGIIAITTCKKILSAIDFIFVDKLQESCCTARAEGMPCGPNAILFEPIDPVNQ